MANSTPIVDLDSRLNSLRVNRERRLDLPTPESPINTTTVCVREREIRERGREGGRERKGEGEREREEERETLGEWGYMHNQ